MKTFRAERCFRCLALGRPWASRYRECWSRWRPKHRKPLRPPPLPLRPLEHTGCNDGQRGAPLAISDGTRAAPVNLRLRPPQQLQRNSGPRWAHQTKRTREAHAILVPECFSVRETKVAVSASPRSARGAKGPLSALSSRSPDQKLSYRLTAKSMATSHNQTTIPIAVTKLQQLRDRSASLSTDCRHPTLWSPR